MPAANKTDLIDITNREYAKLAELLRRIDQEVALQKREDDTSIKDIVAHRAHWIDLFMGWYSDGQAGETVHFPAEGYKWNDLKRYNADLRKQQSDLGWPDALMFLDVQYNRLLAFLEDQSEADLYGGPMKGAHNAWTTGRWAEAAGPSHFRSAAKYIRSVLRAEV